MPTNKPLCETTPLEMGRSPRRSEPSDHDTQGSRSLSVSPRDGLAPGADGACAGDGDFSMWDVADPDAGAKAALDLFGPSAAMTAAAEAAFTARYAGREADFRFWFAVFIRLRGIPADDGNAL
ncbi:hypothetical protein [Chelativorans alearense]|uniref:hypothetical protein n=1 Tax=Chelativorans alearense TaxID=2681495 RepID=UPI0013D195F5|nr:hypothetical protein [Chelativorans alearense]